MFKGIALHVNSQHQGGSCPYWVTNFSFLISFSYFQFITDLKTTPDAHISLSKITSVFQGLSLVTFFIYIYIFFIYISRKRATLQFMNTNDWCSRRNCSLLINSICLLHWICIFNITWEEYLKSYHKTKSKLKENKNKPKKDSLQ